MKALALMVGDNMKEKYAHCKEGKNPQILLEHCENVAFYCQEAAKKIGLEKTMFLIGLLHDSGKASGDFQEYLKKAMLDGISSEKGQINHSSAGAIYIAERYSEMNGKFDKIIQNLITKTIAAHHGLYDWLDLQGNPIHLNRMFPKKDIQYQEVKQWLEAQFDLEQMDNLYEQAKQELNDYISKIFKLANKSGNQVQGNFRFYLEALFRMMLSILIDSDWEDARNYDLNIQINTKEDKKPWREVADKIENRLNQFSAKSKIAKLRQEISKECLEFSTQSTGIYRFPAPTGAGKTLASYRFAFNHAEYNSKLRVFYIGTFKSIIEQNTEVLRNIVKNDDYILETHSNVIPEDQGRFDYLGSRWESPIICTTAVQFFETMFSHRSKSIRRFHRLGKSVIILDEVQTIPIRTIYMFNQMMNFLSEIMQATIILCSATQPLFEQVKLPIHLSNPKDLIMNVNERFEAFRRVRIVLCHNGMRYDSEQIAALIQSKQAIHHSILTVLNTKKDVLNAYQACKKMMDDSVSLYHLSTSMCPQHRLNVLDEIKDSLKKKRGILVFSTQIIEAGVDISFESVIRSLAGLDSILQAAGRCNRNNENSQGEVCLIQSATENLDKLPDIKKAQDVLIQLLGEYPLGKEEIDVSELLSVKSIDEYYRHYFSNRENEMDYKNKNELNSLMDMLCGNHKGVLEFKKIREQIEHCDRLNHYLWNAPKSAGERFEMIEKNTTGVLVPYRKGKEIIAQLASNESGEQKVGYLKKIQRYLVNLYDSDLHQLKEEGALIQMEFGGILVLKEGYYNEETGLTRKKQFEGLMI